jgi:hypothetical protein
MCMRPGQDALSGIEYTVCRAANIVVARASETQSILSITRKGENETE